MTRESPHRSNDPSKVLPDLLDLFKVAGVRRWALIGGAAIASYVPERRVNDLDVVVASLDEVRKIRQVIEDLQKKGRSPFTITPFMYPVLHHAHGHVDILTADSDVFWAQGLRECGAAKLFGRKVYVASKDSLIAMKKDAMNDPTQRSKAMRDIALLLRSN